MHKEMRFPSLKSLPSGLTELVPLMQTKQDFELDFFLETSHFLKWGYEAQGDLGTLPPCRFTISKRGQRVLAGGPEQ